jgi:lipoprotein signal peptidase
MSGFLLRHRLLLLLLAADVATKVAAFNLLPDGRPVAVLPGLRLYLAVNRWGVMGGAQGIGAVTANPAYTMLLALGLVAFAFAVHRLAASSLGFGSRVLAGAAVFLGIAFAAQTIAMPLAHLAVPADVLVATIRFAVLVVSVAFYAASSAPLPRAAFTLLAAGALANAASYAYPPFKVVDFVMVPLQPLLGMLGKSTTLGGDASVGVINLADLYLFTFPLPLLAWPLSVLLGRARGGGAGREIVKHPNARR